METVLLGGDKYVAIPSNKIFSELPKYLPEIKIDFITSHHTAGTYTQGFDKYQIQISDDIVYCALDIATRLCYHLPVGYPGIPNRNWGNIGVGYMCMAGATEKNAGKYPLTDKMRDNGAKVNCVLKKEYDLLWESFVDHAHWSRLDGYRFSDEHNQGNIRWDMEFIERNGKTMFQNILAHSQNFYNVFKDADVKKLPKQDNAFTVFTEIYHKLVSVPDSKQTQELKDLINKLRFLPEIDKIVNIYKKD